MADQKISQLAALATTPANDDEFEIRDVSEASPAAQNKRITWTTLAGGVLASIDYAEAADLSTIEPDDAAAAGSSTEIPRGDHQHAIATAAASTLTGTNAEGSSTSFARADHNHAMPAQQQVPLFVPLSLGEAPTGTANTFYALAWNVPSARTITGVEIKNGVTASGNLRAYLYDSAANQVAARTTNLAQTGTYIRQQVSFDSPYAANPGIYYAVIWFSSATAEYIATAGIMGFGATGTDATPNDLTFAPTNNLMNTLLCLCRPY